MLKFSSIEHYRHVVASVKHNDQFTGIDEETNKPTYDDKKQISIIKFKGTVKLHGTNASVVQKETNSEIYSQSRNNIITPKNDNAGFATFVSNANTEFLDIFSEIRRITKYKGIVVIYGEWCGKGIQKNMGISPLPKRFVIFGVNCKSKDEDSGNEYKSNWKDLEPMKKTVNWPKKNIFNIYNFPTYEIEIDFNTPENYEEKLRKLTMDVCNECPVAKAFGEIGLGEGIVWTPMDINHKHYREYFFKTKGDQYEPTFMKSIASAMPEKSKNIQDFVDKTVTDVRCKQGLAYMDEKDIDTTKKNTSKFVEWVRSDIFKEEYDTMKASGFEEKDVKGGINKAASSWFMNNGLS